MEHQPDISWWRNQKKNTTETENAPKIIAKLNFMFNKSSANAYKGSFKLLGCQIVECPL